MPQERPVEHDSVVSVVEIVARFPSGYTVADASSFTVSMRRLKRTNPAPQPMFRK